MTIIADGHRPEATAAILTEVAAERRRQYAQHGDQSSLPNGTHEGYRGLADALRRHTDDRSVTAGDGTITFADILLEEVFEALAETDLAALRVELVQVAAVAVQQIEAIDAGRQRIIQFDHPSPPLEHR